MVKNNKIVLADEIPVYDFPKPKGCTDFVALKYPRSFIEEFHNIGKSEGTAGLLPAYKYKKNGKEFIVFVAYGTIGTPRKEITYITLIPCKEFDEPTYNDYKETTTQQDLDMNRGFFGNRRIEYMLFDK